jgi:hypothetical protein
MTVPSFGPARCFGILAFACAFAAAPARATYHTFVIDEIFSSADGKVQFVELLESAPEDPYYGGGLGNGQNQWAGKALVSSSGTSQNRFVFPTNLPSSQTAGRTVLVGTQSFAALGIVTPDFVVPDNFLFLSNGAVNYASVDTVSYASLPVDGRSSIDRSGHAGPSSPQNFAGQSGAVSLAPIDGVTEFYNSGLNHFFLTANTVEAASIDAGGSGPGWSRTGNVFKSGGPNTVCRFYGVQAAGGPNGHFYTADPAECEQVKLDPGWHFESLDFAITPAGAGGTCVAGLVPVYRAYNHRFAEHDSNHRITTNFAAYQQQIAAGWTGEGVVMCAQP